MEKTDIQKEAQEVWVSDRDLAKRYRVSRQAIWLRAGRGELPKPVKLGARCTRWRLSEIVVLERELEAESRAAR